MIRNIRTYARLSKHIGSLNNSTMFHKATSFGVYNHLTTTPLNREVRNYSVRSYEKLVQKIEEENRQEKEKEKQQKDEDEKQREEAEKQQKEFDVMLEKAWGYLSIGILAGIGIGSIIGFNDCIDEGTRSKDSRPPTFVRRFEWATEYVGHMIFFGGGGGIIGGFCAVPFAVVGVPISLGFYAILCSIYGYKKLKIKIV